MNVNVVPKSRAGTWSLWLAIVSAAVFLAWQLGLATESRAPSGPPPVPSFNWNLIGYAAAVGCASVFVTGLIGILRYKERSLAVLLVTLASLAALLVALGVLLVDLSAGKI